MSKPAARAIAGLAATSLALLAATIYLAIENRVLGREPPPGPAAALADAAFRAEIERQLADAAQGVWDSTPDAEVGHVLLPEIERDAFQGAPLSTNAHGMRERPYALAKPPGTTRVVLLGDSFVFGLGVRAGDRVGARLEAMLRERAEGPVECLNLGINSWNVLAECAFLYRQLSLLQPDLVVHVVVPNDLDDVAGVRGFGSLADFAPPLPERAGTRLALQHPSRVLGRPRALSYLQDGLDWESRTRYAAAAARIRELAAGVEALGGRYLLLVHTGRFLPASSRLLAGPLRDDQVAYLPRSLHAREHWVSQHNPHWNPACQRRVARALYGLIRRDGLLPRLAPAPWSAASAACAELFAAGRREAAAPWDPGRAPEGREPVPVISFDELTTQAAGQVHGGLYADGSAGPYASVLLPAGGARELRVRGSCLPRPELDGARVRVFADEHELGALELRAGSDLELVRTLPPQVAARSYVSVRFLADDYVYDAGDLRRCVAFRLAEVRLDP